MRERVQRVLHLLVGGLSKGQRACVRKAKLSLPNLEEIYMLHWYFTPQTTVVHNVYKDLAPDAGLRGLYNPR